MSDMDNVITAGPIVIKTSSRRCFIGRKLIRLRNKEYTLMEYFLKNVGQALSRERILEEVWDRNFFCNTNTVDVHVSCLRRKLKKYFHNSIIKTIHCVGYMLEI